MHGDEPTRREIDRHGAWKTTALLGLLVARSSQLRRGSTALYDRNRGLIVLPLGLDDDEEEAAILGVIMRFAITKRSGSTQRSHVSQNQN